MASAPILMVDLPWANTHTPVRQFPTLTDLALDKLASNPTMLNDLSGIDEHLAVQLLLRIVRSARLDYRLACAFRAAGHQPITEAIDALPNLIDAVPTHNALPSCRER